MTISTETIRPNRVHTATRVATQIVDLEYKIAELRVVLAAQCADLTDAERAEVEKRVENFQPYGSDRR